MVDKFDIYERIIQDWIKNTPSGKSHILTVGQHLIFIKDAQSIYAQKISDAQIVTANTSNLLKKK